MKSCVARKTQFIFYLKNYATESTLGFGCMKKAVTNEVDNVHDKCTQ